jgi:3-oxoacyl-[acyl-carrier protein] reductase
MTEKLPDPEKFKQEIPLKRWGTIEELADTIKYIVETQYLTGANIPLNGGL